jgi:hypothetical protein
MRSMLLRSADNYKKDRIQKIIEKWQPLDTSYCACCALTIIHNAESPAGELLMDNQIVGYRFDNVTILCSICYAEFSKHYEQYLDDSKEN